jgi:hypothetical protein
VTGIVLGSTGGGSATGCEQKLMSSTSAPRAPFCQKPSISTPMSPCRRYGSVQNFATRCSWGCAGSGSTARHTFIDRSAPTKLTSIR